MMASFLSGFRHTDDIYEVEKIVDSEMRHGVYVYRVRWKGCTREQDTWEPEENLLTCDDLLKTFKEERENRRKKRKQKRKERRNEFIRNAAPLHVKVKDECCASDSDGVTAEKKKKPTSTLASPSSDMEEFDLSGLTRKQRQEVQKVIEQSKKDAELASPTSSTTDENEQYKRITFLKKPREESSSSTEVICHKKKKIGKLPVIAESSDSEGSVIEPRDVGFSNHHNDKGGEPCTSHSSNKEYNTHQENINREIVQSKGSDEEPMYKAQKKSISDTTICSEDVAKDKGKKPSEILGNIFGTPKKRINSPNNTLAGGSPGRNVNSPVSILSISDDSNDENVGDKQSSKRSHGGSEGCYVPLLDQLQNRMDPLMSSSMSLLQTSIDLSDDNKVSLAKTPSEPYKVYYNSNVFEHTEGSSYTDNGSYELNLSKQDTKESTNIASIEKEKTNQNPSLLTGIPSSSTLKLDAGNNKRTYMKGVENIRNTLAMKRMLMNPDVGDSDKRRKENSPDKISNTYSEIVVSETVIDQGEINKDIKINQPTKIVTETFKRSLSDCGNLQRVRQVISSINISSNKNDTDKDHLHLSIDLQKDNIAHKSTSPQHTHNNNESDSLYKVMSPTYIHSNNENIASRSLDLHSEKDNVNKLSSTRPNNNKTIDSRTNDPKSINNNVLKNVHHKRIPLHKSLSSPAVPNAMKISRSEKLLIAMKSANTTKRPEKSKKLSLKEYNAKKASKQNFLPTVAPIIEFTKIPTVQSVSTSNNTQNIVNNSVDKVTLIPPSAKPVMDRRVSLEKKEKAPKPNQIATNTDVLGNIMECFKLPNGRDSTKRIDIEQGSPDNTQDIKDAVPLDTSESVETDLDEYSGDEDGLLRNSMENTPKPSHLNLPHANTKLMDLLTIYQAMLRGDIDTLIRCDISDEKINAYVDEADTLIMKAVVLRSISAAQILLEKKANPNKLSKHGPRNGKTPLMVAVELNQKSMVLLLVQNNARMNTQTQNGETALIMASKLGHMEIVHVLLNNGADVKPAATYLEKKTSDVPINLLPELQSTLQNHSEKLKEITEKFLNDLLNSRNTQLGQSLMPLRCVSPDEMDEHEFYFKCNINGVEPHINVLMLALPVAFKRNGSVDVKFTVTDNGVKNVYLNDGQMFPTSPGCSFLYFLFPKYGEINTLRIESGDSCRYKLLLCIYSMTFSERVDKTPGHINRSMLIQAASAPVPVH